MSAAEVHKNIFSLGQCKIKFNLHCLAFLIRLTVVAMPSSPNSLETKRQTVPAPATTAVTLKLYVPSWRNLPSSEPRPRQLKSPKDRSVSRPIFTEEGRRATALRGRTDLITWSEMLIRFVPFWMLSSFSVDSEPRKAIVNLLTNTNVTPCRHDEEEGQEGNDDTTKRKKEFSDLFKKQMNLRKVNHNILI